MFKLIIQSFPHLCRTKKGTSNCGRECLSRLLCRRLHIEVRTRCRCGHQSTRRTAVHAPAAGPAATWRHGAAAAATARPPAGCPAPAPADRRSATTPTPWKHCATHFFRLVTSTNFLCSGLPSTKLVFARWSVFRSFRSVRRIQTNEASQQCRSSSVSPMFRWCGSA